MTNDIVDVKEQKKTLDVSFWHAGRWRRYRMLLYVPAIRLLETVTGEIHLGVQSGDVIHWSFSLRSSPIYGSEVWLWGYAKKDEHGTYIFQPVGRLRAPTLQSQIDDYIRKEISAALASD